MKGDWGGPRKVEGGGERKVNAKRARDLVGQKALRDKHRDNTSSLTQKETTEKKDYS